MKTLGWFQMMTFLFGAVLFGFELQALDFDKEIQKREVVNIRVAKDIEGSSAPQTVRSRSKRPKASDREGAPSGTFSVRLIPIKR